MLADKRKEKQYSYNENSFKKLEGIIKTGQYRYNKNTFKN